MSGFDDIIKQKTGSHEAPVPPDAWDNINKKKRKRRFIIWWVLAVLIIAGLPAYLYLRNDEKGKPVAVEQPLQNEPALNQQGKNDAAKTAGVNKNETAENIAPSVKENKQADVAVNISQSSGTEKQNVFKDKQTKLYKKATVKTNNSVAEISSEDIVISRKEQKEISGKMKSTTNMAIDETKEESDIQTNDKQGAIKNPAVTNNETPVTDKPVAPLQQENIAKHIDSANKQTAAVNKKQTPKKTKSPFADISFMPFIPIQQSSSAGLLSRNSTNGNAVTEFKSTNVTTTLDPSVAFQFAIRKAISKKWEAGIGMQYMQLKETTNITGDEKTTTSNIVQRLVMQNGQPVLIDDTIYTTAFGTREINAVNSYRFISIPLFMQYNAGKFAGLDFSLTGGLFFNIHSKYNNSINPVINTQNNNTGSSTGIDVFAGLRFSKMYGRKIGLFAAPSIRFTVKQTTLKNALQDKPLQQAGIAVGISYLIK